MKIKVVGTISAKNLALLLMKTLTELKVSEVTGASLYFGAGDEVVSVSAGSIGSSEKVCHKPTHPAKKKAPAKHRVNCWPSQSGIILPANPIIESDDLPW